MLCHPELHLAEPGRPEAWAEPKQPEQRQPRQSPSRSARQIFAPAGAAFSPGFDSHIFKEIRDYPGGREKGQRIQPGRPGKGAKNKFESLARAESSLAGPGQARPRQAKPEQVKPSRARLNQNMSPAKLSRPELSRADPGQGQPSACKQIFAPAGAGTFSLHKVNGG